MDEIIVLKAQSFDLIIAKQRLANEIASLDEIINWNIKKIQDLELQKINQSPPHLQEVTSPPEKPSQPESNLQEVNSQPILVENHDPIPETPSEPPVPQKQDIPPPVYTNEENENEEHTPVKKKLKKAKNWGIWTEEADEYLKKNWGVRPTTELMKELGRSKYSVETRALKILHLAKRTVKFWTKEEDKYLKENINKSREEIAKELGRPVSGVESRAAHLGILSRPSPSWTDEETAFVKENPELSDREIASKLERRTESSVTAKRRDLGIPFQRKLKKRLEKPLSNPVLPVGDDDETPPVLPVGKNEGQKVPISRSDAEASFMSWIEKNNISEFTANELADACNLSIGLAEKLINQGIHRGFINQTSKYSFLINRGGKGQQKKAFFEEKKDDTELDP